MHQTYTADFNRWVSHTVQLLREHRWQDIDLKQLIEEVEDLGKCERRGVVSQLIRLLLHLLKWHYQPERRFDSRLDSMIDARTQIELALEDSPSLRPYRVEQFESCYQRARHQAIRQTGLASSVFPTICPYALERVL